MALPRLRRAPEALLLKQLGVTARATRTITRVMAWTFSAKALFIMVLGVLEQVSSAVAAVFVVDDDHHETMLMTKLLGTAT